MTNRKPISREQIISMALELLRNRRDVRSLSLREIARALGYAHTNLYNYFLSYPQLLWETHIVCIQRMSAQIGTVATAVPVPKYKLQAFYYTVVHVYLDNTGWFRLMWLRYLREQRPESDTLAVAAARKQMGRAIAQIRRELSGRPADAEKLEEAVRFVHCYLIGGIFNYISSRRVTEGGEEFCQSVVRQTMRSTVLLLREK